MSEPRRPGRPRKYPDGSNPHGRGAQNFVLRLDPELQQYVREQGGGPWLRELIERHRQINGAGGLP